MTVAADHAMLPRVGQQLGPYVLQAILGRGGMGQVYAARDSLLERDVALKVLRQGDAETLLHEGRALAAIDHPNVVRVYGIDVSGSLPFVVMERIVGQSLADLLEDTPPLPRRRCLALLRGVATGLDAIHAAGRIHGDVKPENVLIDHATGRVVLSDLGLSRAIARAESVRGGTPGYMAPERARGERLPPELAPREDVYSLAVMAFELLTGRLPFESPHVYETLRQHAVSEPPRPSTIVPSLPWRVDQALLGGLSKQPELRHPGATAFVDHLERALSKAGGPRILLVDDDGDLAKLLSLRLAKRIPGCSVRAVTCARTAFELMTQQTPDALITDIEMPGMNGLELLASLRNDPAFATLPRAVVSGRATPTDFAILGQLGASRCFHKPVDADALVAFLRDALQMGPPAKRASGLMRRRHAHDSTLPGPDLGAARSEGG